MENQSQILNFNTKIEPQNPKAIIGTDPKHVQIHLKYKIFTPKRNMKTPKAFIQGNLKNPKPIIRTGPKPDRHENAFDAICFQKHFRVFEVRSSISQD